MSLNENQPASKCCVENCGTPATWKCVHQFLYCDPHKLRAGCTFEPLPAPVGIPPASEAGVEEKSLAEHIKTCPQCAGPDDGCEDGQRLEEQSLGIPEANPEHAKTTRQNERQHILESAGYWFKAARQARDKGLMVDALVGMENAYNHVENALAATTDFIEAYFMRGVLRFPDGKTYREYAKELLSRAGGRSLAVSVSSKDSPAVAPSVVEGVDEKWKLVRDLAERETLKHLGEPREKEDLGEKEPSSAMTHVRQTARCVDSLELVAEFHRHFDQPILARPDLSRGNMNDLRVRLIQEELDEFSEALSQKNPVEVLDALTDLQYVLDGAYLSLGFYRWKDAALLEVHRSNMSKLGEDGKPMFRVDGKIMKGDKYSRANLEKLLSSHSNAVLPPPVSETKDLELQEASSSHVAAVLQNVRCPYRYCGSDKVTLWFRCECTNSWPVSESPVGSTKNLEE